MDNKKIGTLIKQLRKKNGITQQELGDMLGIGFRSVSKWERGITCPDITIINELSKILGISSDELLSGKVNKEHKDKKIPSKFKITFSIIITITVILITSFIYYYNQTYTYALISDEKEYYVEGKVVFNKKNTIIIINKLESKNYELYSKKIINYDYQIKIADKVIFGYGHSPNYKIETNKNDIENFLQSFRVNYNGEISFTRKEILKSNIVIQLEFITDNKEIIKQEIIVKLTSIENNKK